MKRRQYLSVQLTLVLLGLSGLVALGSPSAGANPHPGQSVNVAIIGSPSVINGGLLPTSGLPGELGDFTFTNLAPGSVSAASLTPFDTVVLNVASPEMGCDTATLPAPAKADLVSFVGGGKKMIIYDSECAVGAGVDYTWLPFPFTTDNPGAAGATGTLTIVEQNLLSTSNPADPHFIDAAALSTGTDAVGDANVFVTNDPNWCVDMSATNTNNATGATHTYAKYPAGTDTGLFIYNGLDVDFMGFESSLDGLRKIWVQELQHPFNPSNLPCGFTVVGITLSPASASNVAGTNHTVTATVTDLLGNPKPGTAVTFKVLSGPNVGVTGTATTDASGQASFTYTGSGGVGTDKIQACFDNQGTPVCSQTVAKEWTAPPNKPPSCSKATADPDLLWPPNHKFRTVKVAGVTDPDGDPVTTAITGVTQDEPLNGLGDGDTSPDAKLGPSSESVLLRAERSGTGDGRVYRMAFAASDGKGGTCSGVVTVGVPHDQRPGTTAVDSGLVVNSFGP